MKVGIIGLSQSGKTSLYNALTRSAVDLNRYGATEVSVGVISVPDARFDHCVQVCEPKKITPAAIEFTEGGAKIERGERQTDKFGADFFASVRLMDALVLVVRAFDDSELPAPPEGINPRREAEKIIEELLLADLTVVENRLEKLERSKLLKRQNNAEAAEHQVMDKVKAHLDNLQPLRTLQLNEEEWKSVRSYAFVSAKSLILAGNIGENEAGDAHPKSLEGLAEYAKEHSIPYIPVCAKLEMDVAQMEPEEEAEFLKELGIGQSARERLIQAAYSALGLISFFTIGEDEVRAWTIRTGSNAVTAAGAIHSDLARGFIRAEIIGFNDLEEVGGCWDNARSAGKMHLEGKEYIVKDGDIMHVRFKV